MNWRRIGAAWTTAVHPETPRRLSASGDLGVAPAEGRPDSSPSTDASSSHPRVTVSPSPSGLSAHILPTSATMIGVCMTVLSIGHLGPGGELRMIVDKLLAVDALVFLVSALLSFISMRLRLAGARYETRAELVFIAGLGLLALGAVVLAFAIT